MPEPASRRTGTILAFDFGEKRIGVAVGEWQLLQAHPLTAIDSAANAERFAAIAALIREWRPARLVVGLPTSLDGAPHAMTARCQRFARQLHGRFGLDVDYADERLSSFDAQERLLATGHNSRSARKHVDAVAAQLILQNYFDGVVSQNRHRASSDPAAPDDALTDACN